MIDLFDVPDQRELPDSVRQAARRRILAELRAQEHPRPMRAMVPISVAAAAVVVLAGGAVGVLAANHQPSGRPTPPASTHPTTPDAGMVGYASPHQIYRVQDHTAPAGDDTRCKAQSGHEPAGTPGPARWQPILTARANDVSVIAYRTPAGPVFCEVTPATVTLSKPTTSGSGVASFVTQFGSVAGVIDAKYPAVYVSAKGGPGKGGQAAVVEDGVFVLPNIVPGQATVITSTSATRMSAGPTPSNSRDASIGRPEQPAVTVTDRTIPPVDQSSAAGQRLASCFAHAGGPPVVVPQAWTPGAFATLDDHETLQLGHYGNLLAECQTTNGSVSLNIDNGIDNGLNQPGTVPANPYVISGQLYYDFTRQPGGVYGSNTVAVMGVVTSTKVAKIQVSMTDEPTETATVQNGTFLLPGMWPPNNFPDDPSVPKATLTVLDATGGVLARLTMG